MKAKRTRYKGTSQAGSINKHREGQRMDRARDNACRPRQRKARTKRASKGGRLAHLWATIGVLPEGSDQTSTNPSWNGTGEEQIRQNKIHRISSQKQTNTAGNCANRPIGGRWKRCGASKVPANEAGRGCQNKADQQNVLNQLS